MSPNATPAAVALLAAAGVFLFLLGSLESYALLGALATVAVLAFALSVASSGR